MQRGTRGIFRCSALGACALVCCAIAQAGDEEVTIEAAEGVTLAGTLSTPDGDEGPWPGVVLLSGSGPQDRDSAIFGKTPFKVLADAFVERGYAVLRCDDRGAGASTGDFASATHEDFVNDAQKMVETLVLEGNVEWDELFVLGHSAGGTVAAELGASGAARGGVVLLATPAIPGRDVLTDQSVRLLRAHGVEEEQLERVREAHSALMDALVGDEDDETVLELTTQLVIAQTGGAMPEQFARMQARQAVAQLESAWLRDFLTRDTAETVKQINVPALALFGGRDLQVSDEANASPMTDALAGGRHSASRVVIVPGVNHLFQRARTGGVEEYAQLDDLDEGVAHTIADWMDRVRAARDR